MKNKLGRIAFLAAFCAALPAFAQSPAPINDNARDAIPMRGSELGRLESANRILGMEIKDNQGQNFGKVKDLAVDLQNGRIVEVIVAARATSGTDGDYVAVPPGQFASSPDNKVLVLDQDTTRFQNAPRFKLEDWDATMQPANVTQTYQYYSVKPYFSGNHPAQTHAAENQINQSPALGEILSARKLMGMTAQNLQNEKLGKIEHLMVDLPAGRVVEVILASGGFLGMDEELSAVPPQSFHTGPDRDTLTLDTTKEGLSSAPHFKNSEWMKANDPKYVAGVYHAYNVPPYFAVDNSRQNVRDRRDDALTPIKQGSSASDVDTTRQIRKQIMAMHDLSINAQNVKIITIDGRVTLRGPVNSEDEKRQIAEIAARITSSASVDDQLQVKDSPAPSSIK